MIPIFAIVIVFSILGGSFCSRKLQSRWAGLLEGIALQILSVIPVAIAQMTGVVWKSWSLSVGKSLWDNIEYVGIWMLTILFDMGGGTVVSTFEWLVPKRQTWVFSNLTEYSMLWMTKVMCVAALLAWRREHRTRKLDRFTLLILTLVLIDSWVARDFPWWGS